MKKIIPALAVLIATLMLSGCVIFWPDEYTSRYSSRYSITCHNSSGNIIYDWCVVKNGQVTYAISQDENCQIANGSSATLNNLPYGSYVLYVSFNSNPYYINENNNNYQQTNSFVLNENKTITVGVPMN